MVSVIAHEIAETTSDPNLDAWYDVKGNENADKCAWQFGSTTTPTSNVQFADGSKYLLQTNWHPKNGSCVVGV
jgi:hypothetical protein